MLKITARRWPSDRSIAALSCTHDWLQNTAQFFLDANTVLKPVHGSRYHHGESRIAMNISGTDFDWPLKILILANAKTQHALARSLEKENHFVIVADGLTDAQHLGQAHVFDLIIIDLDFAELDVNSLIDWWRDECHGMLDTACMFALINFTDKQVIILDEAGTEYCRCMACPPLSADWHEIVEYVAKGQLRRGLEPSIHCTCVRSVG